jgi:toxin ParE1/3/4
MRRLQWSDAARADLSKIARWSESRWGREQRVRYVAQLRARLSLLRDHPELGPEHGADRPGLRKLIVGAHLAFYRHDDQRILVMRVLDQRMDIETHLGQLRDDD